MRALASILIKATFWLFLFVGVIEILAQQASAQIAAVVDVEVVESGLAERDPEKWQEALDCAHVFYGSPHAAAVGPFDASMVTILGEEFITEIYAVRIYQDPRLGEKLCSGDPERLDLELFCFSVREFSTVPRRPKQCEDIDYMPPLGAVFSTGESNEPDTSED